MPRWKASGGPLKVEPGKIERVWSLSAGRLSIGAIAERTGLPAGMVGRLLRERNREARKARRERARVTEAVDRARTPRPLYARDGQGNPVANERVRAERNPGPSVFAAHTLADNRVDEDFLERLRSADE